MNSKCSLVPNLFKSRRILLNILEKQGYNTTNYKNSSINEFSNLFQTNNMDMFLEKDGQKIYIKYRTEKKVKPADIYEIIDDLYVIEQTLTPDDNLIIISKDPINDTIKGILEEIFRSDGYFVIIFDVKSLLFNILEHELVPMHRVMSKDEKQAFYHEMNIQKDEQMPTISRFDPVAKAICMRPGEVCEIIRSSSTAIKEKYYRLCY